MKSSWQSESGNLTCHWSQFSQRDHYHPRWMQEAPEAPTGYLSPLPDFSARSPFGGVSWFQPNPADHE